MNRKNKIYLLAGVMALLILTACSGADEKETGWYYDSGKYKIVGEACFERGILKSFEELEARAQYFYGMDGIHEWEKYTYGAIVKCTVDGASINRIIEPKWEERDHTKYYGENHVLTPIKIEEIYYAGEEAEIEEGNTYLIKEPFFYIVPETESYYSYYGDNAVWAVQYVPMQKGYHYLVYLRTQTPEIYNYQGESVLSIIGYQDGVYCLESEEVARELVNRDDFDFDYWKLWREVQEHYNDSFGND